MTFSQAFAQARKEGKKHLNGKVITITLSQQMKLKILQMYPCKRMRL